MNSGDRIINTLSAQAPAASVIANAERSVILVRSFFPATEGVAEPEPHLKMGLCMSGGGKVKYNSHSRYWKLNWRRGDLLVMAPHGDSEFASPDVDMLGLAIDLQAPVSMRDTRDTLQNLGNFPSRVITDEVIRSVLVALWTCAEYHGTSGAFIDEGIDIILQRLTIPLQKPKPQAYVRPLSQRQLSRVSEYIQSRIAYDIRVPELAALVGMEPRCFSRALKATTSCAPYAYLVALRMKHAKNSLDDGESIIDTALSVGYINPGKFSAAFRRVVGCTPSQWKRRKS